MHNFGPFDNFIKEFTNLIDVHQKNEPILLSKGRRLLKNLITNDTWLLEEFSLPHPTYYQQYLLHADPNDRFSVVSFVWGPGQTTPIHNHTVWAIIGMMRGSEKSERFKLSAPGKPMIEGKTDVLNPGDIDCVSPTLGDIHRVSNVYDDRISISIHVYGGNIGKLSRYVYDQSNSSVKEFISGYSNVA